MRFNRLTVATTALAVVAAGVIPLASASAVSSQPTTKYRVAMKISTTRAVADEDIVKVTGKVTPAAPGTKVKVQVLYENLNSWKLEGTAKIRKDGTYKYSFTPATRVDRVYRVVKPGDEQAKAGTSKERALQAIGWVWLSKLTPQSQSGQVSVGTLPINGDTYTHTLFTAVDTPSAFVEYTLGRDAYKLDATFGLSDRTDTGGRGLVSMQSDGVMQFSQTFDLGQSEHRVIDVTDVFRIRIDFAQATDTPPTEPSVGAPQVLMD